LNSANGFDHGPLAVRALVGEEQEAYSGSQWLSFRCECDVFDAREGVGPPGCGLGVLGESREVLVRQAKDDARGVEGNPW
jgi:hypothetical protein